MNDVMSEDIGSEAQGPAAPPPPPPPSGDAPGEPGGGRFDPSELLGGLRRSDADKWLAGVAGGIARQWSVETWVVRLGFVVLTFVGVGVPLYILAWLLLPSDHTASVAQQRGWNRNTIIGITIVVAVAGASMAIVGESGPVWFLPWFLIGLGVWFLVRDRQPKVAGTYVAGAAPVAPTDATVVGAPTAPAAPTTTPVPPYETSAATIPPWSAPPPPPVPPQPPVPPVPPAPPVPRPRSFLTPLAIFALLTYAGIALATDDGRWSEPGVVASVMLITIGGVLLLSTWLGRARGLIVFGILVVFPVLISLGSGDTWRDWDAEEVFRPTSTSELEATYEWGFGQRTLDLRDLELSSGDDVRIEVDQIAGELLIVLPPDTTTMIDANIAAGDGRIEWPAGGPGDVAEEGLGVDLSRRVVTGNGRARLELDAELGAGEMTIRAIQPETIRDDEEGPR